MEDQFCLCKKIFLGWIALLGLMAIAASAWAADCAGTPAAAARSAARSAAPITSSHPEGKGYRVASLRWDPVMRQSWATILSCEHPDWPGIFLRQASADHAAKALSAQVQEQHAPVVRAGDIVEVWRQEDLLRIEVTGVAEGSGDVGETIRVRLLRRAGSGQAAEAQLSGVIRGRADVEMQP